MKGLLIKDILVQRKSLVLSAAIIVLYSILFSSADFGTLVIALTVMFSVVMTISTFTYDDMAHWNQYVHAYPVSRKMVVQSKYLFLLLLCICATLVSAAVTAVQYVTAKNIPLEMTGIAPYAVLSAGLLVGSVSIPLVFRFGSNRSRLIIFGLALIPVALVFLVQKLNLLEGAALPSAEQVGQLLQVLLWISPLLLAALLAVSYLILLHIYRKKQG